MLLETRRALFRDHDSAEGRKVTNLELFFDLVFVFAITQLSSVLLAHFAWIGALEALELFLAVWWLWIYTSWATNWLDPEQAAVRGLLIVIMFGSLFLASVLPTAFGDGGLTFAAAYVVMQVVRTLVIALAAIGVNNDRARNFARITFYFVTAGPLWIAGAISTPPARIALWGTALAIEYAGPLVLFATPILGQSRVNDWDISGEHMAERCSLFIIIALGETIVVAGSTYAGLTHDVPTNLALVVSFVSSAAMWWIYFDTGAKRAGKAMADKDQAGRLGRNAYTYLHMPIVAAIVITAVADELMLAHPRGEAMRHAANPTAGQAVGQHAGQGDPTFILVACGGPLLFLVGNQVFKWMTADRPNPPLSHFVGEVLLLATALAAAWLDLTPLAVGTLATLALIVTAAWESFALSGGWRRWAPLIGRRTAIALEDSER